ncbi:MAG TPA: CocE/NonD family hydrolase [Chloroflexota bacterium]|nr:CocE/NonD family hydrolase [Chloroflexota bacterium]
MSENFGVRMFNDVKVPMRDGVRLSADLYLPDAPGPFPTVLMRTPYDNNGVANIEKGRRLANAGYATVIQDCRGRFDSEGSYYPFTDDGVDGFDTQEWIGHQPWSNGRIGMAGASYVGWVQLASAPYRSEFLTCLAPRVMCADIFSGLVYRGGAFQLNVMMTWGMRTSGRTAQSIEFDNWREAFRILPLEACDTASGRDLPFWKDWLAHPTDDEYWARTNVAARWGDFAAPALNLGGWFDLYADNVIANFNGIRQHGRTAQARRSKLVVGPWPHVLSASPRTGDVDFGAGSQIDLESLERRWFDYWLKGIDNGIVDEPPIRLFIMGANTWRDESEWPLARTDWQNWYFHSGGSANTLLGDGTLSLGEPGDEAADHFVYHPENPVQTVGGNNCCSPHLVPWGPYDQRDVEMRGDVLCYTSAPLERDLEVTGPIKVILYAATDGPDTDWTGKLVDVRPSGYAMNLCDGILRARYRESFEKPTLLDAGKVYRYEIDLMVTGNVFLKGHRIRVEISSSNFPRYDRNLNTGLPIGPSQETRAAHQTVLHSPAYPSHVVLPVIPAS